VIRAALALMFTVGVAHAGDEPDQVADDESKEANLESNAPRSGFTISGALGVGIQIGGDIGVGRGGAASFRVGEVATRRTVITLEFSGTGALHKAALMGETLTDTSVGLMAGAQRYTGKSIWGRVAAGPNLLTLNSKSDGTGGENHLGLGVLLGGGFDIIRWGYLVLGVEIFALNGITSDGYKLSVGFATGLSYY